MAKVERRRRRRRTNPEGRMSVLDHLRELRRRLHPGCSFLGARRRHRVSSYPHILNFLKKPYCAVPAKYRFVSATNPKSCDLIYHGVLDGFTTRLADLGHRRCRLHRPVLAVPDLGIRHPGLRKNERRYTIAFIISLDAAVHCRHDAGIPGALQGPAGGHRDCRAGHSQAFLTINDYVSFVTLMLVVFGAAFELPLIVVMANLAGVLSGSC